VAKHLRTTPFGPADTSFPWTDGGDAGQARDVSVRYRTRRGRHAAVEGWADDSARSTPISEAPSAASTSWSSRAEVSLSRRWTAPWSTPLAAEQQALAAAAEESILFELPTRPPLVPETRWFPVRPPVERPDRDILLRVLAALYRL